MTSHSSKSPVVTTVVLLTYLLVPGSVHAAEWGETCAGDPNVCVTNFLECEPTTETCRCQDAANSYYDYYDKKCHLKESAVCTSSPMPCPLNGLCPFGTVPPYKCTCRLEYPPTPGKSCASAYGSNCLDTSTCDHNAFVECMVTGSGQAICQCDEVNSIFDGEQCVLKASQPCTAASAFNPTQNCVAGSECIDLTGEGPTCYCVAGLSDNGNGECRVSLGGPCSAVSLCNEAAFLECSAEGVCNCHAPLEDNLSGVCVAGHDESCAAGEPCDDRLFLSCYSDTGKCQCRPDLVDVGGECRSLIGSPCGGPNEPICDPDNHLVCAANMCVCQDGLSDNGSGGCRLPLGGDCSANLPCNEFNFAECRDGTCTCRADLQDISGVCTAGLDGSCALNEPCAATHFLTCRDDKCACLDGLYPVDGRCVTGLGESCANMVPCDDTNWLECREDVCQCVAPLTPNPIGRCVADFGDSCGNGEPCDDTKFYECQADMCVCRAGTVDLGSGTCQSLIGGTCGMNEPDCYASDFLQCKDNVCQCRDDLEEDGGRCEAGFGGSCAAGETCDPDDYLECNAEVCNCLSGTVDIGGGVCRTMIGESCAGGEPCDETNFLVCNPTTLECECDAAHHDDGNGKCVRSDHGGPCQVEGVRPDPTDCQLYYVCAANEAGDLWETVRECSDNFVFCADTLKCESPDVCPCNLSI